MNYGRLVVNILNLQLFSNIARDLCALGPLVILRTSEAASANMCVHLSSPSISRLTGYICHSHALAQYDATCKSVLPQVHNFFLIGMALTKVYIALD